MSSIVTAVFKATIGLLVNKGRDVAAEKLKEGDVIDKRIRDLIIREVQDIKSKLDGLSRKDLLAAVDSFETGLKYLYKGIDAKRSGEPVSAITAEATERIKEENVNEVSSLSLTDTVKTVSLAAKNIELADFDETTKSSFTQAKKRFEMAREKATDASNNEALSTFDRITAIRYRVMAAMLESAMETVGTAGDLTSLSVKRALENALPECEQCLQKLHSLPAVQNSFKVELEKGLLNPIKGQFGKDERREIISTVCQINRAIYDAQTVGKNEQVWIWPCVDTGKNKVDPLRDGRVSNVLRKVGMEHCCLLRSFGQEGEEKHKLKCPWGIATNTHGQFIIADDGDKTLKVFDRNGDFHLCFNPQTDDADTRLDIIDVATDAENSTYVLVRLKKPGAKEYEREVLVYNNTADLLHKFPVKGRGRRGRLTVSGSKVLVLSHCVVVYEQSGKFLCSFGEEKIKNAIDITAANDGRVMVMDWGDSSVNLFTVEGQQLNKFNINIEEDYYYQIACHPTGEHVVVAGDERETNRLRVAIFTTSGELVRRIQLDEEKVWMGTLGIEGITVTMEGQIAVCFNDEHKNYKVIVV